MKLLKLKDEDYDRIMDLIAQEAEAIDNLCSGYEKDEAEREIGALADRIVKNTEEV